MPPKKATANKASALFIPKKTIPARSGNTTVVGPRSTKVRGLDLEDKGGFDRDAMSKLDLDRAAKGLPSLKKVEEEDDDDKKRARQASLTAAKEAKAAREEKRAAALAKGQPTLPTSAKEVSEEEEEEEGESRFTAAEKGKGRAPLFWEPQPASPAPKKLEEKKENPELAPPRAEKRKAEEPACLWETPKRHNAALAAPASLVPSPAVTTTTTPAPAATNLADLPPLPPSPSPPTSPPSPAPAPAAPSAPAPLLPAGLLPLSLPSPSPPSPPSPTPSSPLSSPPSSPLSPCVPSTPAKDAATPPAATPETPATDYEDDDWMDVDVWCIPKGQWDADKMALSCRAFAQKPAYSIHETLPWMERKVHWELDEWMTEDLDLDAPLDLERWNIETYLANFQPTARCKFEHPDGNGQNNGNAFAPLAAQNGNRDRRTTAADFYLSRESIQNDLGVERPQWVLSAYGPGKDAPEQLWGGKLEQSPEEMRIYTMTAEASGNLQGALQDFEMLRTEAMGKIETAYRSPDAAINYVMQALNQHPNRLDLAINNMNGEFAVGKRRTGFESGQSAFGANPFGQPSAPAQNPGPFSSGTPGFGQLSAPSPTPSAFSQPNQLGTNSSSFGTGSGFGQTPQLGAKPSPFATASAFGQTQQLGVKPNPFGAAPTFGQPPPLGAKPNPFAAPAASTSGPSASPFGAFANTNNSTTAPSPFGAAATSTNNGFQQQQPQQIGSSLFNQPPSNEVSMSAAPTPTANGFSSGGNAAAAPNPFGQPAQAAANPFLQPAQPSGATNPFGQPAQAAAPSSSAPLQQQQQQASNPNHPQYLSYASKNLQTGELTRWKNRPVAYQEMDGKPTPCTINPDGTFSKIWFPDGPPSYYKDTEPDREYTQAEREVWAQFAQNGGKFALAAAGAGGMPLAPPMRDTTRWDF